MLIPYCVWKTYEWLRSRTKFSIFNFQFSIKSKIFNFPNLFFLLVIFYLLFLIKPALVGELGGTFKAKEVPQEYIELKKFISDQPEFFRTFWVPKKQRFAFYSNNHPAIDAQEFFQVASSSAVVDKLKNEEAKKLLSLVGVKYIILPYDSEKEIFVKDRKYEEGERKSLEGELDKISWLRKNDCSKPVGHYNNIYYCSKMAVYEVSQFQDHFGFENSTVLHRTVVRQGREKNEMIGENIEWRMINPTKYLVSVKNLKKPGILIFSETFDRGWVAKIDNRIVPSQVIYERLNSFFLDKTGDFEVTIEFTPQKHVNYGLIISASTLFLTLAGLVLF